MSFSEIMEKHPEAAKILIQKGMHCLGCGMAAFETLKQGAIMHGINPDKLVKEINAKISKKSKTKSTKNKFLSRRKKPMRRKTN